jgi:hypothetical protein
MDIAKLGDVVVCVSDKLKYFTKGECYQVEKIMDDFFGKVRMKGVKPTVSIYNFNLASQTQKQRFLRNEKLMVLMDKKEKKPKIRKLDKEPNKKIPRLITLLLNRIVTDSTKLENPESWKQFYNYYSDIDTYIQKVAKSDKVYESTIKDFEELKNMTLFEALDILIKKVMCLFLPENAFSKT